MAEGGGRRDDKEADSNPILYVFVVGFHHKKGCQVEYCYPPLNGEDSCVTDGDLPLSWTHLPSLALPDGAHNVQKDTVFFLLPSLEEVNQSVYAVSCYRQIAAEDLLSKTADVTRSSVQKSVCVLSRLPLFGLLKAKLELITQAYFNEKDFAKVEVLAEMYRNLRSTVTADLIQTQALLGIPLRDKIRASRHKIIVLFKLFLLEKRVLFNLFPVQDLCYTILSVLSLFPNARSTLINYMLGRLSLCQKKGISVEKDRNPAKIQALVNTPFILVLIESGLAEASFYVPKANVPSLHQPQPPSDPADLSSEPELEKQDDLLQEIEAALESTGGKRKGDINLEPLQLAKASEGEAPPSPDPKDLPSPTQRFLSASSEKLGKLSSRLGSYYYGNSGVTVEFAEEVKEEGEEGGSGEEVLKSYSSLHTDSWGMPLSIFTKGSLCHPYLSLPYLDWLKADSVRAYVFGATNALFRQRKDLWDALVTADEAGELQIEIQHNDLRKQLALTTADLRFADFLQKTITPDTGNVFVDATSWEGGDEWIRLQFRAYLLSLVATAKSGDQALRDDFNEAFLQAWKTTHNSRVLCCGHYPDLKSAVPGHPFAGQFNVSDVKVRLNNMMSTHQGKRLSSAVSQTGKTLAQTGKTVRSAFHSWWGDSTGHSVQSPDTD